MVTFGRVLLWTVVLIAPGGFLLVPVLAAASLQSRGGGSLSFRERLRDWVAEARRSVSRLFHQRSPLDARLVALDERVARHRAE
jgi:hypothetical protein